LTTVLTELYIPQVQYISPVAFLQFSIFSDRKRWWQCF